MTTSMIFHLQSGLGCQTDQWERAKEQRRVLPALEEGGKPVHEKVHAELSGEEGGENEVKHVKGGAPALLVHRISDLRFDHVRKEILRIKGCCQLQYRKHIRFEIFLTPNISMAITI